MRKKIACLVLCLCMSLSVTGCFKNDAGVQGNDANVSGEAANETANGPGGEVADDAANDAYLKRLGEVNVMADLVEKNGRVLYTHTDYMKDGSSHETSTYQDDKRYVVKDEDGTLIIEGEEVYGYDAEYGRPFRMLFMDNFDDYVEDNVYLAFCEYSEKEKISSPIEEKDGKKNFQSVMPSEVDEGNLAYHGYSVDEVDGVLNKYVVDAATDEVLQLNVYAVIDGENVLYSETKLDRKPEEYTPDADLTEQLTSTDTRSITLVADVGTDQEKTYNQTTKKGDLIKAYFGDDFYNVFYVDKECLTPLEKPDPNGDMTLYVKRGVDYSNMENWAYYEKDGQKDVDLFLVAPTVDTNDEYLMAMDDEKTRAKFLGALNMERGIYEKDTRMFAPYYRQGAMKIYSMSAEDREPYLTYAYDDVAAAFGYYLENENDGRPIVLAGFSQGADMCYRLLADYFASEEMQEKLVATYAIGWPCTKEMVDEFPQIKPATAEADTGVVVSIECEAPDVKDTFIVPAGTKAYTINPLTWKTDTAPADKSLNLGACFTDYDANITKEEKGLCGCYIDEERGVIKVTDVDPADYPAKLDGLPEGAYHIYDYQFFFRNLEENVGKRVEAYKKGQ